MLTHQDPQARWGGWLGQERRHNNRARRPADVAGEGVTELGRVERALRVLMFASVVAAGVVPVVVDRLSPSSASPRPLVIALFFVLAVLRTAAAAATRRDARTLPLLMTGALALFGTGSLVLALNPGLGFPSVAEVLFGAAYLGFVGFLVLDSTGRSALDLRALLESGVVAGGIVSAALFLLVTPVAAKLGGGDLSLLLVLVYPLSDVVLVTILLTQLFTRRRAFDVRSRLLLAGLLTLAAVDASLPLGLGSGGYAFSTLEDVVWAAALAALADCAARPGGRTDAPRHDQAAPAVAAGLCAVLVLAVDLRGTSALTHWPAVLTMMLSLGLLTSSLRDARSANEARRLSRTDDLTGLANRRAVVARLAAPSATSSTMMLLDLNGFKAVNDAFGHPEGDRLLVLVGDRLRAAMHDGDLVARLGGDEFAVICGGASRERTTAQAERILVAMQAPMLVGDLRLTMTVAIGIAASPSVPQEGSDLLRRADVAMYRAKSTGVGFCWYDERTDEVAGERLHLVEDLRAGICGGQLRAFFQPQVNAADGTLIGVEALVRWQHPTKGLLAPDAFLAPARAAGLMLPLSLEMVRLCVRQAAVWAEAGRPLRISLNVDPPELLSGAWGPALIAEITRAGLDPALFTVELTEELLVSDPSGATGRVQELARHGIEVSIDDYGTGYSGLAWLQTLPVAELKLARPFVSQVLTDHRTRTIVESTVRLATALHLRVVAEGVEDTATAAAVTQMGVALLQGYLVSPPLLAGSLDTWRAARESRTGPPGLETGRPREAADDQAPCQTLGS